MSETVTREELLAAKRAELEGLSDADLLGDGLVGRLREWEVRHRLRAKESELRAMSDRELLGDLVGLLREEEVERRMRQHAAVA
jgi:hypothetical protein